MSTIPADIAIEDRPRSVPPSFIWAVVIAQVLSVWAALQFGWVLLVLPWALLVIAVAFIAPRVGLYILVTALFFRVGVPGLAHTYPGDILAFAVIGGTLACRLATGRYPLKSSPLNHPILVILAVFAVSLLGAYSLRHGVVNWLRHFQIFALCITIPAVIERDDIRRILNWMLALTFVFSIINIAVFLSGGGVYRIFGVTGAFFPAFLAMAISHSVVCALLADRLSTRLGWSVLVLTYGLALVATQTRAAWLQVGMTMALLFVVLWGWSGRNRLRALRRRLLHVSVAALLLIGVLLSGSVPFLQAPADRAFSAMTGESFTVQTRFFLWKTGLKAFASSPVLGTGLGQVQRWDKFIEGWKFDPLSAHSRGLGAHNDSITYLSETGIIGITAVLWLFATVFWMGMRALRRIATPQKARDLLILWVPICAIIMRFFVGTHTFYSIAGLLTAVYFGLFASYYLVQRDSNSANVSDMTGLSRMGGG